MPRHQAGPAATVPGIFRRYWQYTRGDRGRLLAGGLASAAVTAAEIAVVLIFDSITNHVLARRHLAGFWPLAGLWLAVAAAAGLAMFAAEYLTSLASERVLLRMRDSVFAHAQRLPPGFLDRYRRGDLLTRLTEDITAIEALVSSGLAGLIASAAGLFALAAAAAWISPGLTLVALTVTPLFWLTSRAFTGRLKAAAARERPAAARVTSSLEENLGLRQESGSPDHGAGRLHDEGLAWLRARMAWHRLNALHAPLTYLAETLGVLTVFGFGAWQVTQDRISLGGLLSFAILVVYIYPQVQELAGWPLAASAATASAARVSEILDGAVPAMTGIGR
jgi:ATP-binding cassette subfamily B protein